MAKRKAGRLSEKKKINFAQVGQKPSRTPRIVATVLIGVVAVALFAKFAVVDRLRRMNAEQGRVFEMQDELLDTERQIAALESLPDQYFHYTLSGMTDEELARVRRRDVSDLVMRIADAVVSMDSFRITGNDLSISVTARALGDITVLVGELQTDPMVETISLTTAQSEEREVRGTAGEAASEAAPQEEVRGVRAQLNLFLRQPESQEVKGQ